MNKFKVGDEVRLKEDMRSIYLKNNKEYIVDEVFYDKLFVQGVDFKYDSNIFELVKESNMNKFKVGDKVKLKSSLSCINLNHIDTYTVRKSYDNVVEMIGLEHPYPEHGFNLIEQSNDNPIATDILTPLEAAEAMLNKDNLQIYNINDNKWREFLGELKNVTLEDLKHIKIRHKPKTVVINGVEVAAPVELPVGTKVWYPSVAYKGLQKGVAGGELSIYWLKEEDAQKALDAMLIPFEENDND